MSWIERLFGKKPEHSAATAKERLQLVIAHEHAGGLHPRMLTELQDELLKVVKKYLQNQNIQTNVVLEKNGDIELLKIDVVLPSA